MVVKKKKDISSSSSRGKKSNKIVSKKSGSVKKKKVSKIDSKNIPTLNLRTEKDIALDFAVKSYKKFDKIVKSIVLFGSSVKENFSSGSDIDIILVVDDVSIQWDQELIIWYREELDKIMRANPYKKSLHINTIKLSTWWEDLMRGDPTVLNVLRYGEALIDVAGFFEPLKYLLIQGKIHSTPEAIYTALQRAPAHIARSRAAELNSIEGLYWSMVDSAHAALIAAKVLPPSPEHIPVDLTEQFVQKNLLKGKYVGWYRDLLLLHKQISHGKISNLKGTDIDMWQERAEEFLSVMAKLVKKLIS